jgi:hypothetical protein
MRLVVEQEARSSTVRRISRIVEDIEAKYLVPAWGIKLTLA